MSHEKWFISDTHFFHENILNFVDAHGQKIRPFRSIDEMHNVMVERWNGLVSPTDHVYHLGDVTFKYHRPFNELMYSLNGRKRLYIGNHDKVQNPNLFKHFEKVGYWRGFKEYNFTATHVPHLLECLRDGEYNVHGHTHQKHMKDPRYRNVCCEALDYYPKHIDDIVDEIKRLEYILANS